jgi:hypothetical protein
MARFADYGWVNEDTGEWEAMEIPAWTIEAGFIDESWHNDAAARMRWKQSPGVCLWVAEEDAALREMNGDRYSLTVEVPDGWADFSANYFLQTNDEAEVIAYLKDPPVEFTTARAAAEICSDIDQWSKEGLLQREDIRDFADLHEFCDANGYGGAFEDGMYHDEYEEAKIADPAKRRGMDYWNEVQEKLDEWIKAGFSLEVSK